MTDRQFATLVREIRAESEQVKSTPKRRIPQNRRARLTPEVRAKYDAHRKSGLCVCGCGQNADPRHRGLAKECYDDLRVKRAAIKESQGEAAALSFDVFCQESGIIFPPYDSEGVFATALEAWEAKRQAIESGGTK